MFMMNDRLKAWIGFNDGNCDDDTQLLIDDIKELEKKLAEAVDIIRSLKAVGDKAKRRKVFLKSLVLSDYLTVSMAAKLFGVSKGTIRRWSDEKRLSSIRHPMNNYRLIKKSDVESILWNLEKENKS